MTSPVAVCNKALALLGANTILSLDDNQTEAIVCKAAYTAVRDKVLEDRAWTFATGRGSLTPDAAPPAFGYSHRFLIPSNIIRVLSVDEPEGDNRLKWAREGEYILTGVSVVNIKYIKRVDDLGKWSPAAIDALSYALASEIAVPLTDNATMMERYLGVYIQRIVDAGATDGSQGIPEQLRSDRLTRYR